MSQQPTIDRIIRSRRKTIALVVTPEGQLEVHAPHHMGLKQIESIVSDKAGWIEKQRRRARKAGEVYAPRPLTHGARLWYLGRSYPLSYTPGGHSRVIFSNGFTLSEKYAPQAVDLLGGWYKKQARLILDARVQEYARQFGLNFKSIRITSARTRWGSCSSHNGLSFTWRLLMAPLEIIDYIILHELAHTVEKNHSRAFWHRVEQMLPDYKQRRAWLKANGRRLDLMIEAAEEELKYSKE